MVILFFLVVNAFYMYIDVIFSRWYIATMVYEQDY